MALPTNTINARAKIFSQILDEKVVASLTSGILSANSSRVQFVGGDEVKIPVIKTNGLGNYNRTSGYASSSLEFGYQTKKFRFDRSFKFGIDAMDEDETAGILNTSNALAVFAKQDEAPEVDSARYSSLYADIARLNGRITQYTPNKDTILTKLYDDFGHIQDIVGEQEQLYCFMSGKAYRVLTQSSELNRTMETQEITGQNGVTLKVNSLDGVAIIPVPSLRMKTEYAFKATGGFASKLFAGEMNWLIVGAGAAIAIEKHNNTKIIQAANSELYDADQLMGRLVHDCWLFDEQVNTCAVSLLEADAVNLAGATDSNGVVGFKVAELPGLSTAAATSVTITMGSGTEGVKWYFLEAAAAPGKVNVGSALPTGAKEVTATATETVVSGNYGLLYGVKDGRVVIFDSIKAAAVDVEITAFDAIANVNAGKAGSATYADATAVIAVLPINVTANSNAVTVPVTTWVDTDSYDPAVAGSYTFTATLGAIPAGFANTGGYTATVEVVVAAG